MPWSNTAPSTGTIWRSVEYGTIDRDDLALVFRTDSVDEAFDFITSELTEHALGEPGGALGPVTEPDGPSR